jgi:outer membrane protein OmpA-like peptidoglycan-associated protein
MAKVISSASRYRQPILWNIFAREAAVSPRKPSALRALLFGVAAVALAACAAHKTQPRGDKAQPSVAKPPAKMTHHAPTPPSPSAPVPDAQTAEQDKEHVRQVLAKSGNDTLSPTDVGYFLDVLQGRLQQSIDPGIIISREGNSVVLDLSRRVGFAAESAQIDEAQRDKLAQLSKVLLEYRTTLVSVKVRADDAETASRILAKSRARAVARSLTDSGVAAKRIVVIVPDATARDGDIHVEIQLEPVVRETNGGQ